MTTRYDPWDAPTKPYPPLPLPPRPYPPAGGGGAQ